jgi:conjugative transfer pilus assembly protein TraH
LNPGLASLSVPASKALRPRIAALIDGMVQAIRDDTPITAAQKELLQVSSVPLYKILTVQAAYGRGMPTDDRQTLAEIASVDLLFAVLDRIVSESTRSMASFIGADEAKIALWQGQVNVVRQALADRQANTQAKVGAIMQIIEKTAFIENLLASQMSPGMAAALDWSRAVETRALTH